jgi:hypothetical protein
LNRQCSHRLEVLLASTPQFVVQTHRSSATLNCPSPFSKLLWHRL